MIRVIAIALLLAGCMERNLSALERVHRAGPPEHPARHYVWRGVHLVEIVHADGQAHDCPGPI